MASEVQSKKSRCRSKIIQKEALAKKHLFTVNERLAECNDTDSGNKTASE